ncbi:MAG: vWA domain-containing protein [Phycisphaerales bacterium]
MVIPALIALVALASAVFAERMHARRVEGVARLAFGPTGRPALWARAAAIARITAFTAAVWGAAALAAFDPVQSHDRPRRQASRQLLIALDVSPSMMLKDAGPGPDRVSRGVWAGKVVQGILDRLDTETTRVTLFAFYTDALPVVQETFDKEVIRNALDGLPMYVAFEPGPTDVNKGVTKALDYAKVWAPGSAMLVVLSDGDASAGKAPVGVPDSIADSIVIGVGDPFRSTMINGHASRQDADSLRHLAARLGGLYHNGNEKHLPSHVLDGLSVTNPRASQSIGIREAALIAVGAGGAILGLLGPGLVLFGRPRTFVRARREVARRTTKSRATDVPAVLDRASRSDSSGTILSRPLEA